MSAAFRPGQPTKVTNPLGSQPATPGKPSQPPPTGTTTPNAAQAKFGGKQPAFLNAKTSGMDFGGTVYGAPKPGAAPQSGKIGTSSQPSQAEQQGPASPSAAPGTKLQPNSPLLQGLNTPVAKPTNNTTSQSTARVGQESIKNDGPGSKFQPKSALLQKQAQPGTQNQGAESLSSVKPTPTAPDNNQPGKQTNGFGTSSQAKSPPQQNQTPQANKFGGGQGFGTSFQPKSPLLQSQAGQQVTDGKTKGLQQTSGTIPNAGQASEQVQGQQQNKPFQKTATFGQKQAEPSPSPQQVQLQQRQQQQSLPAKPAQDVQAPKPSDQKFGQKSPEQPQIQQQQKQQLIGQAYVQPQNTQAAGGQQKQLQTTAVPTQQLMGLGQKPAVQPGVGAKPYQQAQVIIGKSQVQTPDVSQIPQQASGPSPGVQRPTQAPVPAPAPAPAVAPKPAPQVVGASDGYPTVTNTSESASKLHQVLQITPSDVIKFEGPFNALTSVELLLTNPIDKPVCYKVKSNSPRYYFVKPAGDLIEPHQHASVYLMLQTPSGERNPTDDDKHKFMIQSLVVQDRQSVSNNGLERLWKSVRQDEIMETIIPCVFVDAPYRSSTSTSQSYYEESRSSEVRAEEDVKKSVKKQKEVKSSSWLPFIMLPIIILLIAFAVYKLKFEGK